MSMMNDLATKYEINSSFKVQGIACSPYFTTLDSKGVNCLKLRTLFAQEMINCGVLMPWIALAHNHTEVELEITQEALEHTFGIYARALIEGVDKYLVGPPIKPVFRKFN